MQSQAPDLTAELPRPVATFVARRQVAKSTSTNRRISTVQLATGLRHPGLVPGGDLIPDAGRPSPVPQRAAAVSRIVQTRAISHNHCACSCFVHLFSFQSSRRGPAGLAHTVGQERLELSTPRLSSVCSNQLSYWPVPRRVLGLSRPNSGMPHGPRSMLMARWVLTELCDTRSTETPERR